MRTSFLMLESALEFASLVDGFVGREIDWRKLKSRPVVYYVVHDSLLSRSCVSEHYERIHTRFGLCHRLDTGPPRYVTTLGVLETGVTDAGLAEFWAQALRKLRKLRFDDAQRRDIARQMLRKGAPLPQQPTWPGAAAGAWGDVLAELAALVRNQDLAA